MPEHNIQTAGSRESPAGGLGDTSLLTGENAGRKSDLRLVRRAAIRRWPVSDAIKQKLVERVAGSLDSADDPRDIASLGKVLTAMEAQNQADDHLQDKNERLDQGKATENCGVIFNIVPVGGTPNESTPQGG